jgi:hypothetical protein
MERARRPQEILDVLELGARMELQITPEFEAKLARSGARQGRKPGNIVEEMRIR